MYRGHHTTYRIRYTSSSESMGVSNTGSGNCKQYRSCKRSKCWNISNNLYGQQWLQYHSNSNRKSKPNDHGYINGMYRIYYTTYRIGNTGSSESMGVSNTGSGNCKQYRSCNRSIRRNISNN